MVPAPSGARHRGRPVLRTLAGWPVRVRRINTGRADTALYFSCSLSAELSSVLRLPHRPAPQHLSEVLRQSIATEMKPLTVGVLVLAMLATVLAYAADTAHQKRCMDNTHKCGQTSDCCSGCCNRGVCDTLDRCNALNQGACAYHSCPPDKECYLHQVQCITAPCPPLPACRPKHHDDYDNYE